MKFLLRLKHWQLFAVTWGFPIAINLYSIYDPVIIFRLFPLMMIVFTFFLFGWIWAIATVLYKKLPSDVNIRIGQFKVLFSIPIIYTLMLNFSFSYQSFLGTNGEGEMVGLTLVPVIIIVHLFSMLCIFIGIKFAAKTMKSVELGELARFEDYSREFFLIWFSPIGIWILQPRLNKLISN